MIFLGLSLIIFATVTQTTKHTEKYLQREKELRDSHGILSEDDIQHELSMTNGVFRDYLGFPNWVCFETKNFKFRCNINLGHEPGVRVPIADENICGWKNGKKHAYWYGRSPTLYQCEFNRRRYDDLVKGEKFVCLSGYPIDESFEKDAAGKKITVTDWVLREIKTKRGCDHYKGSSEDCDDNNISRTKDNQ
jgi:hypothetical protein